MVSQHCVVPALADIVRRVCLAWALTLVAFVLPSAAQTIRPSSQVEGTGSADASRVQVPEVTEQWSATTTILPPQSVALKKATQFIGHIGEYESAKREANAFAQMRRQAVGSSPSITAPQSSNSPSPIVFDGPSEADTNVIPPDPVIAAGPNHIVVVINSLLGVYDKSGVRQGGFQNLKSFFTGLGLIGDIFDPRIIFD